LKDKFGISWQIVPRQMAEWQRSGSAEQVQRMMQAMMRMVKLDIAALEAAFEGTAA
jgi:predicted 3-demethylubiquinone-9 3-methyltransferase (glyoxalase superfamily)